MPDIHFIRAEIEYKRRQSDWLRGEIRELQRSGISIASVEAVLRQMLNKIDDLCAERDRLRGQPL
jgi:uncharacterized membrane protein